MQGTTHPLAALGTMFTIDYYPFNSPHTGNYLPSLRAARASIGVKPTLLTRYSMLSEWISSWFDIEPGKCIPSFRGKFPSNFAKLRMALCPGLLQFFWMDGLHSDLESPTDGSVVANSNFMPSILGLFDTSNTSIQ